jgi:hypothetical protein
MSIQGKLFGQLQPGQHCPLCEIGRIVSSVLNSMKPYCLHCHYDGDENELQLQTWTELYSYRERGVTQR